MKTLGLLLPLMFAQAAPAPAQTNPQKAAAQMLQLKLALDYFHTDCGQYPTTEDGLSALEAPVKSCRGWGPAPYAQLTKDPWQGDWLYRSDGHAYQLTSLGADHLEGGVGEDMDITASSKATP